MTEQRTFPVDAMQAQQDAGPGSNGNDFQASCRRVTSSALLQGGKSIEINHNGAIYRLQSTKLGKLILTK